MNIFILDENPDLSVRYHCDRHVIKMILESAQMLCTAHRVLDKDSCTHLEILYKATHINHPCTVWTRKCSGNYRWLHMHFIALCDEYQFRYGRVHSTDKKLRGILRALPKSIPQGDRTPFSLVMDTECITPGNAVESYRSYYRLKSKRMQMQWRSRETPKWL